MNEDDFVAMAEHYRTEHEATHGEAEQCGGPCIVLGLAGDDEPATATYGTQVDPHADTMSDAEDLMRALDCPDVYGHREEITAWFAHVERTAPLDAREAFAEGLAMGMGQTLDAQTSDLLAALDERDVQSRGDMEAYDRRGLDLGRLRVGVHKWFCTGKHDQEHAAKRPHIGWACERAVEVIAREYAGSAKASL